MAWHVFRNAKGEQWEMNFAGMRLLAQSYCRAELILKNSRQTTTQESLLGPFISLPITNVDINWDTINARLPGEIRQFECNNKFLWQSTLSDDTVEYLVDKRRQTARLNAYMSRWLQQVSNQNYANWSSLDSKLAMASETARLIRDGCFTFIVMASGAGELSIGAALTVAGAGSVLKGAADAQDNWKGSWSDTKMYELAAITTATTFVSAYLPLKVDAAKGAVSAMAPWLSRQTTTVAANGLLAVGSSLTDGVGDAAKAIVQGQSVNAALRIAATRSGTSLASSALGLALDGKIPGLTPNQKFSIDSLTLTSKVTMPLLVNLGAKTAGSLGADRIVEAASQPEQAPMQNVPVPQRNAPFCIENTIATSDRGYILNNVLRPAA